MNELMDYKVEELNYKKTVIRMYEVENAKLLLGVLRDMFSSKPFGLIESQRFITPNHYHFERIVTAFCEFMSGHFNTYNVDGRDIVDYFKIKRIKFREFVFDDPMVLIWNTDGTNQQIIFQLEKPTDD